MINRQTFARTLLIALLTFTASQGSADDTEIYVGDTQASSGVILPNVLLILDTSGSMSNTDGTGVTRLDRMKEALRQLINSTNNVRMGLMRFHKEGGPVLYPVSDINAAAEDVDDVGGLIDTSVASSSDDAEESSTGTMTLDNPQLYLLDRPVAAGLIEVRVEHDHDSLEERLSDNSLRYGSSDLEMMDDGGSDQIIGVRFENIALPADATVANATIEFEIDEVKSDANEALTVAIYGEKTPDAVRYDNSNKVSDRTKTTNLVNWAVATDLGRNEEFLTPNLKDIVSEITTSANGWSSGDDMAFVLEHASGTGTRTVESHDGEHRAAPLLRIAYDTGSGGANSQKAGVRFNNISIPQGATITSAYLEFTAAASSSGSSSILIKGQDSDDADTFATTNNNISSHAQRPKTTAEIAWDSIPAWTQDASYQSPDITTVVQEIVDRSGWCGGNDMAFILTQNASNHASERVAYSFDANSTEAPRLHIEYDEEVVIGGSINGCINQTFTTQVIAGNDDAEEHADGSMEPLSSSDLELVQESDTQKVGIRFRNVNIPKDTTILEAYLTFTADETNSGTTSLTIQGHDVDDSGIFSSANNSVSSRIADATTASVTWSASSTPALTAWNTIGETHVTPDLATIISEITTRAGWSAGNAMSFIITGTGKRVADSYDGSPINSPKLTIKVQGELGSGYTTVRDRLLVTVDSLAQKSGTPGQDTLYEAARYWKGWPVYYGKTRGYGHTIGDGTAGDNSPNRNENTRLSHSASYTGGTVDRSLAPGCTDDNLGSTACIYEFISGSPVYTTPIEEWCQPNHQVLLTDGYLNNNHSDTLINTMMSGGYSCSGNYPCAKELVEYLHKEDQHATLQKSQSITTHTIGFNIDDANLGEMAALGGGGYYTANSAAELAAAFTEILSGVLSQNTSFAAPAVSVNAFNKLYHDNEIYFSLFLPKREKHWPGNLKKFSLCKGEPTDTCVKGEVLDADNISALTGNGTFDPGSRSIWSSSDDGNEVQVGGAGEEVPANPGRTIFTYTGTTAPVNVDLDTAAYKITESDKSAVSTDALRSSLDSGGSLSDTEFESLIYWILGRDVLDEDEDASTTDDRWAIGDSLHGSPLIVTFGKDTGGNAVKKIFMGTNDGGLHMFNAETGVEEWVFMPKDLLEKQIELKNNNTGDHIYGIDGHLTQWIKDVDGDGIIEYSDGDRVWIFFGMRRGGRNYYALDVTPPTTLTSTTATGGITPTLKWRIEGGTTTGFDYLGQTWSAPLVTTVRTGGDSTNDVLIFAGGYEDSQDATFGSSTPGNAIYMVDIDDGSKVWWAGPSSSGADLVLADMTYPIPSSVTLIDSDHDGYDDRLYVGDTGGQLWRIYLGYAIGDGSHDGGVFASVSSTSADTEKRKFFYRPDVAKVSDSQYSSTADYDLISIISGDRTNPNETTVHNQVYAFRDYNISGGLPVGHTTVIPATHLYDATANLIQNADGSDDGTEVANLKAKSGWYINLNEPSDSSWIGEKGLSRTLILDGKLFFTTFIPGTGASNPDTCGTPVGGSGRLYVINALNAAAVYPTWDGAGDPTNYTRTDRTYDVSLPGIPSEPVPVFQKHGVTIVVGGGGGGFVFDPDIALPKIETFWFEEQ